MAVDPGGPYRSADTIADVLGWSSKAPENVGSVLERMSVTPQALADALGGSELTAERVKEALDAMPLSTGVTAAFGEPSAEHGGYASFKGYLTSACDGIRRLYLNDAFLDWLEVRVKDIKHEHAVPNNETDVRSVVWVSRRAMVKRCRAGYAEEIEEAAWGSDPGAMEDHGIVPKKPPW